MDRSKIIAITVASLCSLSLVLAQTGGGTSGSGTSGSAGAGGTTGTTGPPELRVHGDYRHDWWNDWNDDW